MKSMALGALILAISGVAATAEETTIIKRETPSVDVTVAPPVTVERRSTTVTTGCDTQVIHKENDLGESKTIKKTDC